MEIQKEAHQSTRLPLSIIIIAHNAGDTLARTLTPIAPYASEIIAVINDCNDNTKAVLASFNARIVEHPWEGMTAQKNTALSFATQPWVLNLDADEAPSEELVADIIKAISSNNSQIDGYITPRLSYFMGRWIHHGDWYPDCVLRLFKREKGHFFGGKDHEKVKVSGHTKRLKSHLLHYSFPSLNSMVLKMPRFGDVFLEKLIAKKTRFSALQAISRASWRFFRAYILRRGFLDGFPGFYIASFQFLSTLYRYARLYEYEVNKQSR